MNSKSGQALLGLLDLLSLFWFSFILVFIVIALFQMPSNGLKGVIKALWYGTNVPQSVSSVNTNAVNQ